MLEGGLGLFHAIQVVKEFRPSEAVEMPAIGLETKRLVCFENKGFCRYYASIKGLPEALRMGVPLDRDIAAAAKVCRLDPSTEALLPDTQRGAGS
jgi:hypothetical protein